MAQFANNTPTATSQSSGELGGWVGPDLVIVNQARFFVLFIERLGMLAKILPERIALAGLDVVVVDAPHRPDIVIGILGNGGQRDEQGCDKQNRTDNSLY